MTMRWRLQIMLKNQNLFSTTSSMPFIHILLLFFNQILMKKSSSLMLCAEFLRKSSCIPTSKRYINYLEFWISFCDIILNYNDYFQWFIFQVLHCLVLSLAILIPVINGQIEGPAQRLVFQQMPISEPKLKLKAK